jgi:NADPH:quinone reductase-like Zn-dependent oxidoreductase
MLTFSDVVRNQPCAWVQQPGPKATVEFRSIEVPKPGPGQVRIKLEASRVWLVHLISSL